MKLIKKLVDELNEELTNKWGEYVRLHEELHSHKGKPISETDLPEVNRLLKDIQEMFAEIYPALHFIATREKFANNAATEYGKFLKDLERASSAQEGPNNALH